MSRCLQLAALGACSAHPNPMVGCVIVRKGEIIGEGWHRQAGEAHAEVKAIESVRNTELLKEATLYVNLEPCAHFGRTPPCSDRIIREGIPRVVIGSTDPHSAVAGKGIERLRRAGIDVKTGVLEAPCAELNRVFFTAHRENRPFITLKWAQSRDGFIAPSAEERKSLQPYWITGDLSRQRVHHLRAKVDAILIGGKTAAMDNPSLTTRDWPGRSPVRIVWTNRKLPGDLKIFNDSHLTWVAGPNVKQGEFPKAAECLEAQDIVELLPLLFDRDIIHLLVEGGTQTLQPFLDLGLWDDLFILQGESVFSRGTASPRWSGAGHYQTEKVENDLWLSYRKP